MMMVEKLGEHIMKNPLELVKNAIAPEPETLWERGGAKMTTVEIDPGHFEEVPFFDLEIIHRGERHSEPMFDELKREIGTKTTRTYVTSDGIDRATRVFMPIERHDMFTIQMTTPLTTSIDGHNTSGVAETISRELGVTVILIGAEHSSRKHKFPFDIIRIPETIQQSRTISLAKTSQSGQLITSDICGEYGLSKRIIKTGESRASMETDAEYVYAPMYGCEIIYQDKTASCLPDRVFSEGSETGKLVQFPGAELVGAAYVTARVISENKARNYLGTVSLNPNFIISTTIGISPALATGEAGRSISWLPKMSAGHHVTFDHDVASRPHRFAELYSGHPLMASITVNGSHATLAHTETLRHLIDRISNFTQQYWIANQDLEKVNWRKVHLRDDDRYHTPGEARQAL